MDVWDEIRSLHAGAPGPPEGDAVDPGPPVTPDLVRDATGRDDPDLVRWLSMVNGSLKGPGGLFGVRPDEPFLDLAGRLADHPCWVAFGWLPVAGDGSGNVYVLLTDGTVGFVDVVSDPCALDGMEAPTLPVFLRDLLARDRPSSSRSEVR